MAAPPSRASHHSRVPGLRSEDAAYRVTGPDARRLLRSSASAILSPTRPRTGASHASLARPTTGRSVSSRSSFTSRKSGQTYYSSLSVRDNGITPRSTASHQRMVLTPSLVPRDDDGNPLPSLPKDELTRGDTRRLMRVPTGSSVGSEYVVQLVKRLGVAQSQQDETNRKLEQLEKTLQGLVTSFSQNKLQELQAFNQKQAAAASESSRGGHQRHKPVVSTSRAQQRSARTTRAEPSGGAARAHGPPTMRTARDTERSQLTTRRRRRLQAIAANSVLPPSPSRSPQKRDRGKLREDGTPAPGPAAQHQRGKQPRQREGPGQADQHTGRRRKPPIPKVKVRTGREMYARPKASVTSYAEGVSIRQMARPGELSTSQPRFIYGRE